MNHAACPNVPARRGGSTARHTRVALARRASFWVSAGVVAHTLWTSAAPAMTYRLYASEWHLTPTTTAEIFAIYPVVVVSVLILFGGTMTLFLSATAITGAGYSLLFLSALEVINGATSVERRGGTLSALYLLGYLAVGLLAPEAGSASRVANDVNASSMK
ncbi:hypothetical protein [Paraburkholderia oxyphila]|uniref:hypothetical protein n=1 Tax=Paraburkholderia oxyphila TaxID=614212 RepID=UPI00048817BE|nr:hypothetical protein [Paraburkholderia oxyphila]